MVRKKKRKRAGKKVVQQNIFLIVNGCSGHPRRLHQPANEGGQANDKIAEAAVGFFRQHGYWKVILGGMLLILTLCIGKHFFP